MATTFVGPVQNVAPGLPGGISAALNVTAVGVIKSTPGVLARIVAVALGTGNLTLYDAGGNVTAQTITGITAAANAVVTLSTGGASNPYAVGNSIIVSSAGGMTQINGLVGTVVAIGGASGAWTVTTSINSSAFTAYTSGGTAASFGTVNEIANIPVASLTAVTPLVFDWPCGFGILVQGTFPSGGQYSFSFS